MAKKKSSSKTSFFSSSSSSSAAANNQSSSSSSTIPSAAAAQQVPGMRPLRKRNELPTEFTVVSSDNDHFVLSSKTMYQMKTLAHLVENLEPGMFHQEHIVLESVKGRTMRNIVEWCEKHKDEEPGRTNLAGKTRTVVIPEWDGKFLDALSNSQLFDLICAANYLEIPLLMDYSCKAVANMAKGKTPTEMRKIFGIRTDEEDAEAALYLPGPSTR